MRRDEKRPTIRPTQRTQMPDFLTRRDGVWHFVRRVPKAYAHIDARGVIRHSTRIRVADDRAGRRAGHAAQLLNDELEGFWRGLAGDRPTQVQNHYDEVRRRARALGFEYIENSQLVAGPIEQRLERIEALVSKGLAHDLGAREALLGTVKPTSPMLSQLFEEYAVAVRDEIRDMSADQLRIWRNGRKRAVSRFAKLVGDKPLTALTASDAVDYCEWWRGRIVGDAAAAKTANKDIGQLSRMLKELSIRHRLNLPDFFHGLRLRGEVEKSRQPYEVEFIQNTFLAGRLDGLNVDARFVIYVMIETGMRPSEIVNLTEETIVLDVPIPYARILPNGRRLKTEDSERDIPLVGVALEALKRKPRGFPKYRDRATVLSATVNKFLAENGMRPSKDHTLYSLRHSFKDRLVAAEAPDSLIDSLMGHKTYKPKYGKGPPLALKQKALLSIAFPVARDL